MMDTLVRQHGLPAPVVTEIVTGLCFIVWLKDAVSVNVVSGPSQQASGGQVANKYRTSTGQVTHQVTHQVKALLTAVDGQIGLVSSDIQHVAAYEIA